MTIPASLGYQQYSGTLVPPVLSNEILMEYKTGTVFQDISNTRALDELRGKGDTIRFLKEPDVTIKKYTKNQEIVSDTHETKIIELNIDEAWYFACKLDDIDFKLAPYSRQIFNMIRSKAAEKITETVDTLMLSNLFAEVAPENQGATAGAKSRNINLGQFGAPVVLNEENCHEILVCLSNVLTQAKCPKQNRFIIVPPEFEKCIQLSTKLSDAAFLGNGQSQILNGKMFNSLYGFDIYVSHNLPMNHDTVTDQMTYNLLAGCKDTVAFASCLDNVRVVKPHNTFSQELQGLVVFGYGVLHNRGLANAYVTIN